MKQIIKSVCITFLALASLVAAQPLFAQMIGTGSIEGTVLDQQGHVIVNATVTATDKATGRIFTQPTSAAGVYVLTALPPATYTVGFEATGFAGFHQDNVIVNAFAVVGLNATLKIGSNVEQVTVSSAPPDLPTENGTLETTIPNDVYTALPNSMNGEPKDPLAFRNLIPGSVAGDFGVQDINGGPQQTSFIYQNGFPLVYSELQGDARPVNASTTTEVVDQFQIMTSGISAAYAGQGVTNLVLKSGTNSFHGDVYENVRNTIFDAAGFFSATAPVEHQNEYGFSAGGPVLKNKLFFFFNLDRYRYTQGSAPAFYTLPTAQERAGDFSQLLDPTLNGTTSATPQGFPIYIYDPATTVINADGTMTRCVFGQTLVAGGCIGTPTNIIPSNRLSSVAKAAQSSLTDTINGQLTNNYWNTFLNGDDQTTLLAKVDWTVNDKHHAFFMWQRGKTLPLSPYNGGPTLPGPYYSGQLCSTTQTIAQVGETWTIRPTLVNVFGSQFSYNEGPCVNPNANGWPAKLGITGLPSGYAQQAFPPFAFGGGYDAPTPWAQYGYTNDIGQNIPTFVYQDNLQWVKGKHSVTFGGQIIAEQENTTTPSYFGGFGFSTGETAGFADITSSNPTQPTSTLQTSTSGSGYASYLLGLVDNASASDTTVPETGARYKNIAFYAQDNYKVTPRLTLNIGLRYNILTPFKENHNRNSWFNPLQMNSMVGIPGALQFDGYTAVDSCNCETQVKIHWLAFDPRLGFAWSLNNKTTVRGAYTINHYAGGWLGGNSNSQGVSLLGYSSTPSFSSSDGGITPAFQLDNGFPAYTHPPFFDSTLGTGYNTTTGPQAQNVVWNNPELGGVVPYTQNWNFTIDRSLTSSMNLEMSYAGSGSRHTAINGAGGKMSNQVEPKYMALGSLLTTTLDPTSLAQAQAIFPEIQMPYPTFVGSIGQAILAYPQYSGISNPFDPVGSQGYNSLQIKMQRRTTNGLFFLAGYTWSKVVGDGTGTLVGLYPGPRTAYNVHELRHDSTVSPQVITLAWEYDLPFGKGQRFSTTNGVLDAIAGGWSITAVQTYNSPGVIGIIGAPCSVPYSGSCWADLNPNFTGNARINGGYGHGATRANLLTNGAPSYINKAAFQIPALYTYGTAPRAGSYGMKGGNWYLDEDATIGKNFGLFESVKLRLQADAFNLFNRVEFGGIDTNIADATFGQISGQVNSPRNLQFEAYLKF